MVVQWWREYNISSSSSKLSKYISSQYQSSSLQPLLLMKYSMCTLVLKPKQVGPKIAEDFIFDFERECCLVLRSAYRSIKKNWLFRQSAKMWGCLQWNANKNGTCFEKEWMNSVLIYAVITKKYVRIYFCHKPSEWPYLKNH